MNLILAATILIPIFYNGAGQAGSFWHTSVALDNFAATPLEGHGVVFLTSNCEIPEGCPILTVDPGEMAFVTAPYAPNGLILHPRDEDAQQIEIQASFGERRRHAGTAGVELPIARDDDFRSIRFGFPLVRFEGGYETPTVRTLLRIYSLDPAPGQQVRVELQPLYRPAQRIADRAAVVTLAPGDAGPFPLHPSFAQVDLQREFAGYGQGTVRVDVVPLPNGNVTPRVWAFVTITHNQTNEVTVISPQ
ncbi:MAG: hypothetical protein M3Q69_12830 [Acidobacteriota bacterium]|nr:hypothetical protein [Acidobacteriota bacterium]